MATSDSTVLGPEEWTELLGRFVDGIALVEVTQRSLVQQDIGSQEQFTLSAAITHLGRVYDDLDIAVGRLTRVAP